MLTPQCVSKQFAKLESKLRPNLFSISYCILYDVFLRDLIRQKKLTYVLEQIVELNNQTGQVFCRLLLLLFISLSILMLYLSKFNISLRIIKTLAGEF